MENVKSKGRKSYIGHYQVLNLECLTRGILTALDERIVPILQTVKMNSERGDDLPQSVCQIHHPLQEKGKGWIKQEKFKAETLIECQGPAMIVKVLSPDLWHQHHWGTCQEGIFPGPNPNLLTQDLWVEPSNRCFNWPSKLFRKRSMLRTTDPGKRVLSGWVRGKQVPVRGGDKMMRQD